MFRLAALFGLLGLAATTAIIIHTGYQDVLHALSIAGIGILWSGMFHMVPLTCCVIGWRLLIPDRERPSFLFMSYILWLRTSVNNMMPVARIGGEFLSVRVMIKYGMAKTTAIASTVVELTTSVIAVFLFDIIGIALFTLHVSDIESGIGWKLFAGLLLSVPPIGGMIIVQKVGLFGLLDRIFRLMIRDKWKSFTGSAAELDNAVYDFYRRPWSVAVCTLWQFTSWTLGFVELAIALDYLGHPLPLLQCFMLEALIQAMASAAFIVPGALGVQEAGFVLFGHMLGLSSEIAAALALIRRCRDLMVYVPGLIAWQIQEGRWLLKRSRD